MSELEDKGSTWEQIVATARRLDASSSADERSGLDLAHCVLTFQAELERGREERQSRLLDEEPLPTTHGRNRARASGVFPARRVEPPARRMASPVLRKKTA
jgi:hypothetical protein